MTCPSGAQAESVFQRTSSKLQESHQTRVVLIFLFHVCVLSCSIQIKRQVPKTEELVVHHEPLENEADQQ